MAYFATSTYAGIKEDPSLVASLYEEYGTGFKGTIGVALSSFPEDLVKLMFCGMIAFEMFPYGDEAPGDDLSTLLEQTTLACNGYVSLAWQLFMLNFPTNSAKISAIGWNGGAVGNHIQLFASAPGNGGMILVDRTYGFFAAWCSPQLLIEHYHVPATATYSFFAWDSAARIVLASEGVGSDVSAQNAQMISFVESSLYKFTDFYYQWDSFDRFSTGGASGLWLPPQGQAVFPPS